ncbi:MAG: diguanylate cyclase [Pseudomonadota bacterium]
MARYLTRLLGTRNRTLLVNAGVVALLSLVFVLALTHIHHTRVNQTVEAFDQSIHRIAVADIDRLLAFFENRAYDNLASPGVLQAMRAKDPESLLALTRERFEVLKRETPELEVMQYHAADGTSLGRIHYPGSWGDPISASRPMLARVHEEHVTVKGMELGRFGLFLRLVVPAFIDGKYVGALEFGLNPKLILRRIREEIGAESLLIINPAAAQKLAADLADPLALACHGAQLQLCLEDSRFVIPEGCDSSEENMSLRVDEHDYILHNHVGFNDHEGQRVARLLVLQDVSPLIDRFQAVMALTLTSALAALIAVLLFLRHTLILMEHELAAGQARLRAIVSSMDEGVYMLDTKGLLVFINPAALRMLGYEEDELLGRNLHDIIHHTNRHGEHVPSERCPINLAIHRMEGFQMENDIFWRKDGQAIRVAYTASPVLIDDHIAGSVAVFRDDRERLEREEALSEARRQSEELNRQLQVKVQEITRVSETDALTMIANRAKFNSVLQHEYSRAQRYGTPLSLILFDIDHFKRINDTHGHLCGDKVLREVARLVGENLRSSDHFARWGGEEFVILTPENQTNAKALAEKIRALIAHHPFEPVGALTCSFGVTRCDGDATLDDYLMQADKALYRAKESGRNRVETAGAEVGA